VYDGYMGWRGEGVPVVHRGQGGEDVAHGCEVDFDE
jgi:hypothetical protein